MRDEQTSSSDRHYLIVWALLMGALGVSLALGAAGHHGALVATIFAVAVAKAGLVLTHFMHLRLAPRLPRLILVGAVAVVVVLYLGLLPDITWVFGAPAGR